MKNFCQTTKKKYVLVKSGEIMSTSKDEFLSKGQSEYKALCVCGKQQTSPENPTDYTEYGKQCSFLFEHMHSTSKFMALTRMKTAFLL